MPTRIQLYQYPADTDPAQELAETSVLWTATADYTVTDIEIAVAQGGADLVADDVNFALLSPNQSYRPPRPNPGGGATNGESDWIVTQTSAAGGTGTIAAGSSWLASSVGPDNSGLPIVGYAGDTWTFQVGKANVGGGPVLLPAFTITLIVEP